MYRAMDGEKKEGEREGGRKKNNNGLYSSASAHKSFIGSQVAAAGSTVRFQVTVSNLNL